MPLSHAAHDARADRAPAFSHGESHPGFERDGVPELELDLGALARPEHALREEQLARHVALTEVELRRVGGGARRLSRRDEIPECR